MLEKKLSLRCEEDFLGTSDKEGVVQVFFPEFLTDWLTADWEIKS